MFHFDFFRISLLLNLLSLQRTSEWKTFPCLQYVNSYLVIILSVMLFRCLLKWSLLQNVVFRYQFLSFFVKSTEYCKSKHWTGLVYQIIKFISWSFTSGFILYCFFATVSNLFWTRLHLKINIQGFLKQFWIHD